MPGTCADLWPQFLDDLVGTQLPFAAGFQPHEHAADIIRHTYSAGAYGGHEGINIRVLGDYGSQFLLVPHHVFKGNTLGRLGKGKYLAGIFRRQEPHRNFCEQKACRHRENNSDRQGSPAVVENNLQGSFIGVQHSVEKTLHQNIKAAVPLRTRRTDETAAEHRGERQGDKSGYQDRHADGHRKFVEDSSENPAHEEHRDEDSNKGKGHGQNGKADFFGTGKRSLEDPFPFFYMAHDIFEHDDSVIHHKPDRKGQGHEGDVVHAESHQIHRGEGADDGERQRKTWNNRSGEIAKEKKNDHHYKAQGEEKGEFDVPDGFANGYGAVIKDLQLNRRRYLDPEDRKEFLDAVHHFNGVRARLALDCQNNGAFIIIPVRHLVVFHAVDDPAQFFKTDRRAVAVGHNQRAIGCGIVKLPGCLNSKCLLFALQSPCRKVHISQRKCVSHVINADLFGCKGPRVELGADRKFLRAEDLHLGNAADHRNTLGYEGIRIFIDCGNRKCR